MNGLSWTVTLSRKAMRFSLRFWRNLFENAAAIQFNHRTLAYIVLVVAIWVAFSLQEKEQSAVRAPMGIFMSRFDLASRPRNMDIAYPLRRSICRFCINSRRFSCFLAVIAVVWRSRDIR